MAINGFMGGGTPGAANQARNQQALQGLYAQQDTASTQNTIAQTQAQMAAEKRKTQAQIHQINQETNTKISEMFRETNINRVKSGNKIHNKYLQVMMA